MLYETIVTTAAASEPVTLTEAKAQLRIDSSFEDAYVTSLISIARDRVEKYCNRYFTIQVVDIVYHYIFPLGSIMQAAIVLPFPDLTSVDSVSYTDVEGATIVIAGTEYSFNPSTRKLIPVSSWPTDSIDFTVEVTTAPPAAFDAAKQSILMVLTDLYELRVDSVVGASIAVNPAVINLMQPYRVNIGI
jgi:uncharacterized phiE125 gp8 family phage protein